MQETDGLVAVAGVQYMSAALEYPSEKITEVSWLLRWCALGSFLLMLWC